MTDNIKPFIKITTADMLDSVWGKYAEEQEINEEIDDAR